MGACHICGEYVPDGEKDIEMCDYHYGMEVGSLDIHSGLIRIETAIARRMTQLEDRLQLLEEKEVIDNGMDGK